ncbi:MAG: sigma-54-dependent Fis family transcriptional regulator [Desulfocapsa sp.]|nr:sigma-54-dependent Fis family transcriptional regulator [Desulfocapsa sp.]
MARILIIDDDVTLCYMLHEQLNRKGYETESANTLKDGLLLANQDYWDCILLDVQMPDGNGLTFLPQFVATHSSPEVIIITGHGAADGAEKAILGGAWSYIEKPHVIRDLPLHLARALQFREEKQRMKIIPVSLKRGSIIGNSEKLSNCLDQLASAASSDISVLITGETGTGKELFAQALHDNSERSKKPFVVVDCASLPDTLIESTLFGHVKGAFTGADRAQEGLIQHAHQGTLFLDEVGELPLAIQKKFLRILQERKFRPVGGTKEISSDFRLVAATNRDLSKMVEEGLFRNDLLFRLHAMNITLPPLRERIEDVRELVIYFLEKLCDRYSRETKGIAPDFIEGLTDFNWPGNIRELHQTVEQIFAESVNAPTLYSIHLPQQLRISIARAGIKGNHTTPVSNYTPTSLLPWKEFKSKSEHDYMKSLMQLSDNNIRKACEISTLSRARIYQLLDKHSIIINPQK